MIGSSHERGAYPPEAMSGLVVEMAAAMAVVLALGLGMGAI